MSLFIPEISFIVSVYNDEKYLSACIESILAQSNVDFEIIVINDGSNDKSLEIATSFSESSDNVKVFSFENSGLSISRNRGIERASGKYIQFVDSDDLLPDNSISHIIKIMEGEQLDLYCGSALVIDEKGNLMPSSFQKYVRAASLISNGKSLLRASIGTKFIASACLYIVKRNVLGDMRFFPNIYHEDNLFTIQLYLNQKVKKALHTCDLVYLRRIRVGSITQVKHTYKHSMGFFRVATELKIELLSGKYDSQVCSDILFLQKRMLKNVMSKFYHIRFVESVIMFLRVFNLMPFTQEYLKLHCQNIYSFLFHNNLWKRLRSLTY